MVRRMKSDATARSRVESRSRRSVLLLFALVLVLAQVVLFLLLRTAAPPAGVLATNPSRSASAQAPAPGPSAPAPGKHALAGPANQPGGLVESGSETEGALAPAMAAEGADSSDDQAGRAAQERAEREKRDRERAEREHMRLEAERDRIGLKAEKERARLEVERAEKARLEAEQAKAEFEAERARLAAERARVRSAATLPSPAVEAPGPSGSPDVLVVVVSTRAGAGSLSRDEIRNIYFGKTTLWPNNTRVRAYTRPSGSAAGRKFYQTVLGTSPGAFREHWNGLQRSGGGIAPATITSAESIIARVAGAPGAIGFVLESELPADVSGVRLIRFK